MRIIIDRDSCEAQALCVRNCGDIFSLDENDLLHFPEASVPEEHEEGVRRAVLRCPKQALSVEE